MNKDIEKASNNVRERSRYVESSGNQGDARRACERGALRGGRDWRVGRRRRRERGAGDDEKGAEGAVVLYSLYEYRADEDRSEAGEDGRRRGERAGSISRRGRMGTVAPWPARRDGHGVAKAGGRAGRPRNAGGAQFRVDPREARRFSAPLRQTTTASSSRRMTPGEVTEWSNVRDWKSRVRATVPGVRIPPSPPVNIAHSFTLTTI